MKKPALIVTVDSDNDVVSESEEIVFAKITPADNSEDIKQLNENVTILIKSFMREECVVRLVESIRRRYKFIKIIVVDDSNLKMNFEFDENIKTYNIPFDSGLSAGRNYGVNKIDTPYFILLDDDFIFTERTDLIKWFDIMKKSNLDLLGGDVILDNKRTLFFGNLIRNGTTLIYDSKTYFQCEDYKTCDIVLNFFIAKTKKIRECPWNEDLKLAEHTAYFLHYKNVLKVGHTDKISILHQQERDDNYNEYRNRSRMFLCNWMKETGIQKMINFKKTVFEIIEGNLKITVYNSTKNKRI